MKTHAHLGLQVALALAAAGCSSSGGSTEAIGTALERSNLDPTDPEVVQAQALLGQMTLDEKIQQMSGPVYNQNNMFDQADNTRLSIPGFRYMDGPRGVRWYNSDYGTTVFPVGSARGSTWDPELERLIGKTVAKEMRYLGRHVHLAPTINQIMHPRWGRAQESYAEDTHILGVMGAAYIEGVQYDPSVADPTDPDQAVEDTYRVQACAKHFAANNLEDQRIYVNAVLDERTLREVYLPHFKKAVDAGVATVMAAYNRVNGEYSCYSKPLLRDILKKEWKFKGWVMSDWFAKGNTLSSPPAGLDVEMPFSSGTFPNIFDSAYFYGSNLTTALNGGLVDKSYVDEAVLRLLYAKIHNHVTDKWNATANWTPWLTKSDHAQSLALQAAREGIVLLKNGPTRALTDDVLPLDRAAVTKMAVIGKFAASENMGDKGSSDAKVVDGELVITPYEGIHGGLPADNDLAAAKTSCTGATKCVITYEQITGANQAAVSAADVVVIVAAYFPADLARTSAGEEGEWKDRVSMSLPQRDLDNIAAAVALKASKPALKVIVVVKSGGVAVVHDWLGGVDAVIQSYYAGMREGVALAEIVFGDVNPSGKLTQSIPKLETDLPAFNNSTQGDVAYDYYHGYRWLDKKAITPEFAFGFGEHYTTFAYSNLQIASAIVGETDEVTVTVDVTNTGTRTTSEVVQAYVGFANTAVKDTWGRPVKQLEGFTRAVDIAAGETRHVSVTIDVADLAYWDAASKTMKVEKMAYQLFVGPSSDATDPNMLTGSFTVH